MNYNEITITKYESEFVAKHKDYDVIGVGGNEFEAVLELSKALGALMFSKDVKAQKEHELLGLYEAKDIEWNTYETSTTVEERRQSLSAYLALKTIIENKKEIEEMK